MKVLMISNSSSCYGANNSLIDLLVELQKWETEVIVFVQGYGGLTKELKKMGVRYFVIPYTCNASCSISFGEKYKSIIDNIVLLKKARKIVKENNIEIIHTNASNIDFGAFLSIVCNIPHVWHIRELLEEDYRLKYHFPYLEKYLMYRADCLIAISQCVAKKRIHTRNGIIIYNGFNTEKYVINKKCLFNNEIINILYCGQITEEKGVFDAIKAMQKIVQQGHKNYRMDIVGEKGEYCTKLLKYVKKNNLMEYIHFHGYQVNMKPYREKADIALMCSYNEAFGRVTVESMLGECLVIGANSGGTPEIIKEGKNGYLYEAGNVDQLVEKILSVHDNIEKSMEIVKTAKKFAMKQFNSKRCASRILNVYEKCLARKKNG